eukprot:gene18674-20559_t
MTQVGESVSTEVDESACQTIGVSDDQPSPKRRKVGEFCPLKTLDLEARLHRVLSCTVCLDLPFGAIYQCQNGHLNCSRCFNHLLADARLKNESAKCPSCRIEISHKTCTRNLAVESAVSELPAECRHCRTAFTRGDVTWHENELCMKSSSSASPNSLEAYAEGLGLESSQYCILDPKLLPGYLKFNIIGCNWEGVKSSQEGHEDGCNYPLKTGHELMDAIEINFQKKKEETDKLKMLMQMMSCEKISICDIQLSPCRSDDFLPKLYYESNRFNAFDQSWMIKASVHGNEKSLDRNLTYQVISRTKCNMELKYYLVKGPYGELDIIPDLQRFEFTDDKRETARHPVVLKQSSDCDRLLSTKTINVRMFMFFIGK